MPGDPSSPIEKPGRIGRAVAWSKDTAQKASARADRERERHTSVDVGFRSAERQRRVAAMVLAGGIAYRIFFWTLAVSVVVGGVCGLLDPDGLQTSLQHHGFPGWAASAAADLARSSDGNEWWLLLVGGWLVLWTGYTCSKALVLAHGAIWNVDPPRIDKPVRASLLFNGCTLGFMAAMGAARWIRAQDAVAGLVAALLVVGVPFGFWLFVSHTLPNRAAGWLDLVPGAAVVAIGLQAMHLFTLYFLGPKLASATQLYGVFGVVTTFLFWFYLGGRLIVAGATLNVEAAETRATGRTEAQPLALVERDTGGGEYADASSTSTKEVVR